MDFRNLSCDISGTIDEICKTLHTDKIETLVAFHRQGLQRRIDDFLGSEHIPDYVQYIYDFIKERNPELHIFINKKIRLKDNRMGYLQIYVKEKNTTIFIDYEIDKSLLSTKVIKLNKNDFSDIILLSKAKILLIKKLDLNPNFLENKPFNVFEYIEGNKSLNNKQLKNKLYLNMLNTMMLNSEKELEEFRDELENNIDKPQTFLKIKKELLESTEKLKGITTFFDI